MKVTVKAKDTGEIKQVETTDIFLTTESATVAADLAFGDTDNCIVSALVNDKLEQYQVGRVSGTRYANRVRRSYRG